MVYTELLDPLELMAHKTKIKLPLQWFLHQALALFLALLVTDGGWALVALLLSFIPLNIWFYGFGSKLKGKLVYVIPYLLLVLSFFVTGFFV